MLGRLRGFVKLRVTIGNFGSASSIEEAERQRRSGREKHIVETDGPALKQDLTRPSGIEGEPQLDDVERDIFVERVEYEAAHAVVIGSAVNKQ